MSFENTLTFENVRVLLNKFAKDRDWEQFHTPKNLVLAATSEIGELSEIFQWKKDDISTFTDKKNIMQGKRLVMSSAT